MAKATRAMMIMLQIVIGVRLLALASLRSDALLRLRLLLMAEVHWAVVVRYLVSLVQLRVLRSACVPPGPFPVGDDALIIAQRAAPFDSAGVFKPENTNATRTSAPFGATPALNVSLDYELRW